MLRRRAAQSCRCVRSCFAACASTLTRARSVSDDVALGRPPRPVARRSSSISAVRSASISAARCWSPARSAASSAASRSVSRRWKRFDRPHRGQALRAPRPVLHLPRPDRATRSVTRCGDEGAEVVDAPPVAQTHALVARDEQPVVFVALQRPLERRRHQAFDEQADAQSFGERFGSLPVRSALLGVAGRRPVAARRTRGAQGRWPARARQPPVRPSGPRRRSG